MGLKIELFFLANVTRYSRVCGRVIAYQQRNTVAFNTLVTQNLTLEQHIWMGSPSLTEVLGLDSMSGHLLVPWVTFIQDTHNSLVTAAVVTRVLYKHIHPAHTFYDIMLQMTPYALNEKHNEYA